MKTNRTLALSVLALGLTALVVWAQYDSGRPRGGRSGGRGRRDIAARQAAGERPERSGTPDWELDHVMTVVGFLSSQNLQKKLPNQPVADDYGYFIVKNSWGDCWGDQGYVYLPWTWVKTFTGQASTGILPE